MLSSLQFSFFSFPRLIHLFVISVSGSHSLANMAFWTSNLIVVFPSLCLSICSRGLVHYYLGGPPHYLSRLSGLERKDTVTLRLKKGAYLLYNPMTLAEYLLSNVSYLQRPFFRGVVTARKPV